MSTINIYLNFAGNCEEALLFYKTIFRKEFSYLGRYGDFPSVDYGITDISSFANKILHVSLPISKETILMACDNITTDNDSYIKGNNFSISVSPDSREEADRLFSELSEGGIIQVEMKEAFWGDYFGQFTDKFGINWMIIAD